MVPSTNTAAAVTVARSSADANRALEALSAFEERPAADVVDEALAMYLVHRSLTWTRVIDGLLEVVGAAAPSKRRLRRAQPLLEAAVREGHRAPSPGEGKALLLARARADASGLGDRS